MIAVKLTHAKPKSSEAYLTKQGENRFMGWVGEITSTMD